MKTFAKDLKTIYTAANEESARKQLEAVTRKWSGQYPSAMNRWNDNWDAISPIFKFSKEVRTAFYTTNAIESLNSCYRRLNKQRSVFPSSQALMKALYLGTFEIAKMDNANPELGQSTWWTGNHVPGSVNIAIKVGRSRVNIRPDHWALLTYQLIFAIKCIFRSLHNFKHVLIWKNYIHLKSWSNTWELVP